MVGVGDERLGSEGHSGSGRCHEDVVEVGDEHLGSELSGHG